MRTISRNRLEEIRDDTVRLLYSIVFKRTLDRAITCRPVAEKIFAISYLLHEVMDLYEDDPVWKKGVIRAIDIILVSIETSIRGYM